MPAITVFDFIGDMLTNILIVESFVALISAASGGDRLVTELCPVLVRIGEHNSQDGEKTICLEMSTQLRLIVMIKNNAILLKLEAISELLLVEWYII